MPDLSLDWHHLPTLFVIDIDKDGGNPFPVSNLVSSGDLEWLGSADPSPSAHVFEWIVLGPRELCKNPTVWGASVVCTRWPQRGQ